MLIILTEDERVITSKFYQIHRPYKIECILRTTEKGTKMLKSPYRCVFHTTIETLEGRIIRLNQLQDVENLYINNSIPYATNMDILPDWIDVTYTFSDLTSEKPFCAIRHKNIICSKYKWDMRDDGS